MKRILSVIVTIFLYSSLLHAQKELNFEFDYARFNYDSTSVFLEFYFELNPKNMEFIKTEKGNLVEAVVHLELKNSSTNQYVINKDWKLQQVLPFVENDSIPKSIIDVMGFVVPEGKYSLVLKAKDARNQDIVKMFNENLVVEINKSSNPRISDLQLARNIKLDDTDKNSIFFKNSMEVIPNPTMLYSNQSPVLFYYAELYNLKLPDPDGEFTLRKNLFNSSGQNVSKLAKAVKQSNTSVVEYGVMNLSKFPSDSYTFELSLVDNKTNKAYVSSKRFYLYNPNVQDPNKLTNLNAGVVGSEFGLFSLEECNKMFSQAKYLATQKEIDQFSRLDSLKAKREFLYNFWKNRDDIPSTPINEFKEEYMKRVELANRLFSRMNKEGYLTDRGRILLLYGEPDQKDYYPNESNMKPYEVWFYSQLEGGANFIFGDISGFGNYELLHSTKRGELQDENWQRRLQTAVQ